MTLPVNTGKPPTRFKSYYAERPKIRFAEIISTFQGITILCATKC
jgi:hypothetical protein